MNSSTFKTEPLRIAIAGSGGRMGQMLIAAVRQNDAFQLTVALEHHQSPHLGQDAGAFVGQSTGVLITDQFTTALAQADVLIDFTRPEGTLAHLDACLLHRVAMVIGTTGFTNEQKQRLQEASQTIPMVLSPNMSIGVNVTLKLLALAARALGDDHDIEIIEAHHRHKVDAPSGTALKMGQVIADALQWNLDETAVYARQGHTGERNPRSIGFSTIRGGDIVGDHTVLFAGLGERIEITHKSSSRATYAQGSLKAAAFLKDKSHGLFDMFDVLGL